MLNNGYPLCKQLDDTLSFSMSIQNFPPIQTPTVTAGTLPKLPQPHLERTRLISSLQGSSCRLRLLVAPAGYGKTVLMADCARRRNQQVVWVSLHGRPMKFHALLQKIGEAIWPGAGPWTEVELESALLHISSELWLMLDDFPREVEDGFDAAFGRLLTLHGSMVTWWVSTRRRPACNLPRLMLQGDLMEVGIDALAFSATEIRALLGSAGYTSTKPQEISEATRGWCAAVAFLMRPGTDVQALMLEYLQDEVLDEL